ncbi:hypothetical protein SAMN05519103_08955 [Rhizobiales bacterium GAS113]|nr:hypothetical protein SAMN05519103_05888 [Rhizobiales bacterium GAS113]SDR58461.1 hypothetical protein SAMN05519103_06128 [Rhizobiales bacterium GAS113]SDR63714.1 hypothetical protein SAMN05519103_08955 [Rhizobiales bacterium GAS113]
MIIIAPAFQPDLFQPTEPPRGKLPATLQPQTVALLCELLLKIIETAPTVSTEEKADE